MSQIGGSIAVSQAEKIGYKTMNPVIYYSGTLVLYVIEVWLSIIIKSIAQVFGFIGAFAGTSLSFFIPSILFTIGYRRFATNIQLEEMKKLNRVSIINFIIGIFFFGFFLYACIIGLE